MNPALRPNEVMAILQLTAVPLDSKNPEYIGMLGAGRVDAAKAVAEALRLATVSGRVTDVLNVSPAGAFVPVNETLAVPTIAVDKSLVVTQGSVCAAGSLIKLLNDRAVYYCGGDGKRYVFPNEKVFKSWYPDFSTVKVVSAKVMASLMIGGNVTSRPGVRMVKLQTDPKVYVVGRGGVLRAVPDEATAAKMYGAGWRFYIDDVSDAFFVNYTVGVPVI